MPLEYPTGTIAEHLACRTTPSCSTCPTSARCSVDGADALDQLQAALTNDLGKIAPGPGPVHPPARRRRRARCSTTSSCGGTRRRRRRRRLRRDAERLEHRPGPRRRRRRRDHRTSGPCSPCRVRRPLDRLATVFPEAAAVGRFRVAHATWHGVAVHRRRHRLHGRARRRDRRAGRRRRRPLGGDRRRRRRAGRARRPRHAAPRGRRCRCTATSSARASRRCRPGSAGSWRGTSRRSAAAPRSRPSATPGVARHLVGIATEGRRPPRADCAVARRRRRRSAR